MDPATAISFSSTDPDELLSLVQDWQLEFSVMNPGGFYGEFHQILYPDVLLGRGRFSDGLRQQGMSPPGFRTFVIPLTANLQLNWRGHSATGRHLLLFPENGELFSVANLNFDVLTLSVRTEDLIKAAEKASCPDPAKRMGQEIFVCPQGDLQCFGRDLMVCSHERIRLKQLACSRLPFLMCEQDPPSRDPKTSTGVQWIRMLEKLKQGQPDRVIDLNEFCGTLGISRRTLDYHIKTVSGLGPRQYLNRFRLNAVRRELKLAEPNRRVGEVARRWGFHHLGQFSTDYRKLFGECPSDSLKNGSSTRI